MALVSPGIEVTIIDESNYVPAATNSVPYILLATAQNKASAAGVGVAAGTLASNAGKIYLITSQRDLAATFGTPFFYKTSDGTPINGYELNEYGLLAAHSVLGISNRAYIQRADIDLTELTATLTRPTGAPDNDTYWLDTASTAWGVFQWNSTTGAFSVQPTIVITSTTQLTSGVPSQSVGNIGDYAVVATNANNPIYFKSPGNTDAGVAANSWVLVGSNGWKSSWPTVQGANTVTSTLTSGNIININGTNIAVPVSPNDNLAGLVNAINSASIAGITAQVDANNRITIYGDGSSTSDSSLGDGGIVDIDPALSTAGLLTTLGIVGNTYYAPALQQSYNYTVPRWRTTDTEPRPTGSVWNMMTAVNSGANIVTNRYDATLGSFVQVSTPIYENDQSANNGLDSSGGGRNIAVDSLYAQYDTTPEETSIGSGVYNNVATFKVYQRAGVGATTTTGTTTTPVFVTSTTFSISASAAGSDTLTAPVTATVVGTTAAAFTAAVSAANVPYVSATVNSDGSISFTHSQGGVIAIKNLSGTPVTAAGFTTSTTGVKAGAGDLTGSLLLSAWETLTYTASAVAPDQDPATGRLWYYAATDQVDIMIQSGTTWAGYRTVSNDVRGYNLTQTDPTGPIISASEPIQQSDNTPLVYGDLWVNTSNLESYPALYRWQSVDGVDQWVELNNTDQTTSNGILFADARWAPNGTTDPITANIPTIDSLLTSNYLDIDAPSPTLYPTGMLLFNTRRSGFNVKRFEADWFNATRFSIDGYSSTANYVSGDKVLYQGIVYVAIASGSNNLPTNTNYWSILETNAWVNAAGNRANGSPYMGRLAVRQLVVAAMRSAIDSSTTLREEQLEFNLMATPQYPELMTNMVRLNNERNNTAFVIGDTPLRLGPQGADLLAWANNTSGDIDGESGLVTADPYLGTFYPSCQTTDLSGSLVVTAPSHMMLRTIVRSDAVAFPWLAPAGTRRGVVDNADRIGYIEAATGEFVTIATGQGVRDVLYENRINPITFIPGVGITNFGNKTTQGTASALDRINVSRLVAFLRGRLEEIGNQFVFEPNDQITRNEITNAVTGLLNDLVAKRGIYDYLVVCDLSNNTPARIDRNELYVDIAIEPVKAVEFIYIPVRIKNTGEISAGQVASASAV
jgi:phage tail sheath protein FI